MYYTCTCTIVLLNVMQHTYIHTNIHACQLLKATYLFSLASASFQHHQSTLLLCCSPLHSRPPPLFQALLISFHFLISYIYFRGYTHCIQLKCLFNSHLHGNTQLPTQPTPSKQPVTSILLCPLQLLICFLVHQKKEQHRQALRMENKVCGNV